MGTVRPIDICAEMIGVVLGELANLQPWLRRY
jgi:hypothetical protein